MMKQQVIYVFTHDSIGLGEDGPTHQPIEHLASLRSIPNLFVVRPCDAIETFEAWEFAIKNIQHPTALILSRQNLPLLRNDFKTNKLNKGGYFLRQVEDSKFSIISTGSEVSLAVKVYDFFKSVDCELICLDNDIAPKTTASQAIRMIKDMMKQCYLLIIRT